MNAKASLKYLCWGVFLCVGIAIYLFWAIPFRSALNFHEQFQLFICDWDYFLEHLTLKGGLAIYLSEFLVQFYNNWWLGAGIITAEFLVIHQLVWRILRRIFRKHDAALFLLSFIPMSLVFVEIGDTNTMHSLFIAVIEVLLWIKILTDVLTSKKLEGRITAKILACVILVPLFAFLYIWTAGPDHRRSVDEEFSFDNVFDREAYDLLDFDFLVRANDWDGVIKKAERSKPQAAMSIAATNLALGMKRQLGRRASQFPQPGTEGLVPPFRIESFSALTTAEIYFQLGLVNIAQRFYFEANEGLPNMRKSCRCIRRLAETNLINGQYEVAKKYLRLLRKTVFYRLWAEKTLALIERGEFAIDTHPLYGKLRRFRLTDDFFFFESEIDQVCGRLFLHDRNNSLALQYLLMHPLLANDSARFAQYLQIADEFLPGSPDADSFRKYLPQ